MLAGSLCHGDLSKQLRVDIFDHESSGHHKFIGCNFSIHFILFASLNSVLSGFMTTLQELAEVQTFNVINARSKKNKKSSVIPLYSVCCFC